MAGGLLGVGGGMLFVPGLAIFLDKSQLDAVSTSLVAVVLVALVGTWRQHGYGNVRLRDGLIVWRCRRSAWWGRGARQRCARARPGAVLRGGPALLRLPAPEGPQGARPSRSRKRPRSHRRAARLSSAAWPWQRPPITFSGRGCAASSPVRVLRVARARRGARDRARARRAAGRHRDLRGRSSRCSGRARSTTGSTGRRRGAPGCAGSTTR